MKAFRKFAICLLLFANLVTFTHAQVVATIDGEEIKSDEFLYAFNKNRPKDSPLVLDSLESYLEQYINFKLKVRAAKESGLDTAQQFKQELEGYISQIKKPYLENPKAEEALLKETYKRMQSDLNASHILIKVSPTSAPQDTLKAFQFLDSLRNTIGSRIEFEEMARKYSQDGSAKNGGYLGWFTALQMVPEFEEEAYKTPVGKVSEVVRSNFGYHIIYINDKRQNRGKIRTSHIFFSMQRGREAALQKAQMVYDSLQNGASWELMARKYSDDQGTKIDSGKLPWAGVKQLPDEFLAIAYTIPEIGSYTPPKETPFGWHIIKLNDVQPLEPFEIKKDEISETLKRMGRNTLEEEKLLSKLKAENGFDQNLDSLNNTLDEISKSTRVAIFGTKLNEKLLFTHGGKNALVKDFLNELPAMKIQYAKDILISYYEKFEKNFIIAYEDSVAPVKYPEYRFLMQEYEEGLLLFEIMQRKVWDKAVQDSTGLKNYYDEHKSKYQIGERINCLVITSGNSDLIKKISEMQIPKDSLSFAEDIIQREVGVSGSTELKFAKRSLLASEFSNFEAVKSEKGNWIEPNNSDDLFLNIEYLPAGIQAFEEIKGIVMSDYQEELDKNWINELRNSAKIKINKKELKAISKN